MSDRYLDQELMDIYQAGLPRPIDYGRDDLYPEVHRTDEGYLYSPIILIGSNPHDAQEPSQVYADLAKIMFPDMHASEQYPELAGDPFDGPDDPYGYGGVRFSLAPGSVNGRVGVYPPDEDAFDYPETLPTQAEGQERKAYPLATGLLDYFPDALAEVAHASLVATAQHGHGEMHWDRNKSFNEEDTLLRHFVQRGEIDSDGIRHSAKVAWRALALLQKEIEEAAGGCISPASRASTHD